MQIADKNSVAMPANWPNNEIVKDHVIIPPAKDVKTAKERLKKLRQANSSVTTDGSAIRN